MKEENACNKQLRMIEYICSEYKPMNKHSEVHKMSIFDSLFRQAKNAAKKAIKEEINSANKTPSGATVVKDVPYVFGNEMPKDVEALKALPGADLKDPFKVAALTVAALCQFPIDRDASVAMLNYLRGPRPLSPMDISFIKDRFMDGVDYVPRSYLTGAAVANDYTPAVPYTVHVLEMVHSKDIYDQGYYRLFFRSGGADNERYLDLRHKPSTDQWFLWEFGGLLVGIRTPVSKDPWA